MAGNQDMAEASRRRSLLQWVLWAFGVIAVALAGSLGYLQHQARTDGPSTRRAEGSARSLGEAVRTETIADAARPQPPTAKTRQAPGTPVARAALPRSSAASAPALRWPLWEFQVRQPIPAREPPLTPPTWRLLGATGSAGSWKLIILRQGKQAPEFYSTGDSLPGGYVIGRITEEDVTLIQGKRAILLSYIGT